MLRIIPNEVLDVCNTVAPELMLGIRPILQPDCNELKPQALQKVLLNVCFRYFTMKNGSLVANQSSEWLIKEFTHSVRYSMDIHPYRKSREDAVEAAVEKKVLVENTITFPL